MASQEFVNWSGSLRFKPLSIERARNEEELKDLVLKARSEGRTIRPLGHGHSSSKILKTSDYLVSMENFKGLISFDKEKREATLGSGFSLAESGEALLDVGLAMHNLGDVNVQTVAGAIATGTHGSGLHLGNLATMLIGGKMILSDGSTLEFSEEEDVIRAMRVSIGALGLMTEVKLRLLPSYQLRRREWCTDIRQCLDNLDDLIESNRNFDFYWYPRSDRVKLRTLNDPDEAGHIKFARLVEDVTGWSGSVISKVRTLRFDEMEYSMPAESGVECFSEVREAIKEKHRRNVGWRVLYRLTAPDDSFLSNAYGRQTVSISLHQNNTLPYREYFEDIEHIFRSYGGRPHWAKKHSLAGDELRELYPEWESFQNVRRKLDPDGTFLSNDLKTLLGG